MSNESVPGAIPLEAIKQMQELYQSNPVNKVITNIVSTQGIKEVCLAAAVEKQHDHAFSHRLQLEGRATSQKSSGRCWLFAACNVLRQPIMRSFGIGKDWELSQAWLFFWDKLEKTNLALQLIIDTVNSDPDQCSDRLWSHVLSAPQIDGGQYTMFLDVISKYGLVPKSAYGDAHAATASQPLNWLINNKIREAAWRLKEIYMRAITSNNTSADANNTNNNSGNGGKAAPITVSPDTHAKAQEQMRAYARAVSKQVHHVLVTHLGEPPQSFVWRVSDGGHVRTITKAMAKEVCAHWGENVEEDAGKAKAGANGKGNGGGSDGGEWDAMSFLRLVVEPCIKHGWTEETKPGFLCSDENGKPKTRKNGNSGNGKKSVVDAPMQVTETTATSSGRHICTTAKDDNDDDGNADGDGRDPTKEQVAREDPENNVSGKKNVTVTTDSSEAGKGKGLNKGPSGTSPARDYLHGFISLVNDPRHEYWRTYTVEHLGSVWGGHRVIYVNVPSNQLLGAVVHTIANRCRPVWFGCDSGKYGERDKGIWDPRLFAYADTIGTEVGAIGSSGSTAIRGEGSNRHGSGSGSSDFLGDDAEAMRAGTYGKRERVLYGESLMTHAMVFTGVDLLPHPPQHGASGYDDHKAVDVSGLLGDKRGAGQSPATSTSTSTSATASAPQYVHRLRIENSWSESRGDKGYYSASVEYFHEFVYQAVVHLDDMTEEMREKVKKALTIEPVVMPLWDPMGALAG